MIGEKNKLIAEFLELTPCDRDCEPDCEHWFDKKGNDILLPDFSKDWNALMPVVEKIEHSSIGEYISFSVNIINQSCCIYCHFKNAQDGVIYQTPWGQAPDTKIEAVYTAVIEFIKWYNQQHPLPQ